MKVVSASYEFDGKKYVKAEDYEDVFIRLKKANDEIKKIDKELVEQTKLAEYYYEQNEKYEEILERKAENSGYYDMTLQKFIELEKTAKEQKKKISELESKLAGEETFSANFNGLDFAEHDKKYVDEIKALKNQISELEFRLENEKERKEIKEKCAIDEIVDIAINMNYAIREKDEKISKIKFKLSCAEAEIDIAKELLGKCPNLNEDDIKFVEKEFGIKIKAPRTDFFTKIGLDDEIKVKLTPYGVDIYRFHHIKLKEEGAVLFKSENVDVDKKGYTRFKMRDFMKIYGKYIDLFDRKVIEPADIILCD